MSNVQIAASQTAIANLAADVQVFENQINRFGVRHTCELDIGQTLRANLIALSIASGRKGSLILVPEKIAYRLVQLAGGGPIHIIEGKPVSAIELQFLHNVLAPIGDAIMRLAAVEAKVRITFGEHYQVAFFSEASSANDFSCSQVEFEVSDIPDDRLLLRAFSLLREVPNDLMSCFLRHQVPGVIATIFSLMADERAVDLLKTLPHQLIDAIMNSTFSIEPRPRELIVAIVQVLTSELCETRSGVNRAA